MAPRNRCATQQAVRLSRSVEHSGLPRHFCDHVVHFRHGCSRAGGLSARNTGWSSVRLRCLSLRPRWTLTPRKRRFGRPGPGPTLQRPQEALRKISERPLSERAVVFFARLAFRGIYFPQVRRRHWIALLWSNRRVLLSLSYAFRNSRSAPPTPSVKERQKIA